MNARRPAFRWGRMAAITLCLLPSPRWLRAQPVSPDVAVAYHRIQVRHPGFQSEDPLPYTLEQLRNEDGYPTGYRMVVDSVICLHEQCEVIKCSMLWDALGRYLQYELVPGTTLTKSPDTPVRDRKAWREASRPFTPEDHRKLDALLRDPHALLKDYTLESIHPVPPDGDVDGVTGATPLALEPSIVKGGVYTCFNLWHWAQGEVPDLARELTHQHCDEHLLGTFLAGEHPHEIQFALEHLLQHRIFSPGIIQQVTEQLPRGDAVQAALGLTYLEEAMVDPAEFHTALAQIFSAGSSGVRLQLLEYLAGRSEELPPSLLESLSLLVRDLATYPEVHRLVVLLETAPTPSIESLLAVSALLQHDDFFIARRAYWFLMEQALNPELQRRVDAFRNRHRHRQSVL